MTARFIVRLLDAEDALLAWTEVSATTRPQGRPRSTPFLVEGLTQFVIEREGVATQLTIHWAEVDVVRRGPAITPRPVQAGQVFEFTWLGPVWMIESGGDLPLPQVTVRAPVALSPPTGGFAARDPR